MTDQQGIFHTLICEDCFEANDCETRIEIWVGDNEKKANMLIWSCPVCDHPHRLELEGDVGVTVQAYNQHIRAIKTGLQRALKSGPRIPDKERLAYEKRLKKAKKLDKVESGNKHVQRVEFGYWVRRLRLGYGTILPGPKLSIETAAQAAGISREHWARLELGQRGYSRETVLLISAVIGGTVERAYEMAGFKLPPRLSKTSSRTRMQAALERYLKAVDIEDETQWLIEALMARRSFRIAKVGFDNSSILGVPPRAYATTTANSALIAIDKLTSQKDRIHVFRAVSLANLTPDKRLKWILEIVMHVLTDEQRRELLETLLYILESVPEEKS